MTQEQARPPTPRPPRYKQAVVTWLGVYPALTLTLAVQPSDGIVAVAFSYPVRQCCDGRRLNVADPAVPDAHVPRLDAPVVG